MPEIRAILTLIMRSQIEHLSQQGGYWPKTSLPLSPSLFEVESPPVA